MSGKRFDVVVVGAGPAGLSAALILGRMRRQVLLLDTDAPANAVSGAMHGFLAQDGVPPARVRRIAAGQLEAYAGVERRATAAISARRVAGGFEVALADGTAATGRRLLLAHGTRYGLPAVEGASELWGERIFHCPYCHGWEVRERPLAVYAGGAKAVHQALLLGSLSDEIVLLAAGIELSEDDRGRLKAAGVEVVTDPVERLAPAAAGLRVEFATDRPALERHALFVQPELSLASEIAPSLGAALTPSGSVETGEAGQSTVPGLYVAGDAATEAKSVAIATGSGARAAYALNLELAMESPA